MCDYSEEHRVPPPLHAAKSHHPLQSVNKKVRAETKDKVASNDKRSGRREGQVDLYSATGSGLGSVVGLGY